MQRLKSSNKKIRWTQIYALIKRLKKIMVGKKKTEKAKIDVVENAKVKEPKLGETNNKNLENAKVKESSQNQDKTDYDYNKNKKTNKMFKIFKEYWVIFGLLAVVGVVACCYLLFAQPAPQPSMCNLIAENITYASFIINDAPYSINTKKPISTYQLSNLSLNGKNVTIYTDCEKALNLKNNPDYSNISINEIKSAKRIYLITDRNNAAEGLIPLFEFGAFCANGEYKYLNATCSIETDLELIKLANKSAGTFVLYYTTLKNENIDINKENAIMFSSYNLNDLERFNNYLIYKILGIA